MICSAGLPEELAVKPISLLLAWLTLPLAGCQGEPKRSSVELRPPQAVGRVGYSRGGRADPRRERINATYGGDASRGGVTRPPPVDASKDVGPRSEVVPVPREVEPIDPPPHVVARIPEETGGDPHGSGESKTGDATTEGVAASSEESGSSKNRLTKAEIEKRVRSLLERLAADEKEASKAYREIWRIDAQLVPRLLDEVVNRKTTNLAALDIIVRQKDFSRFDEKGKRWFYFIKGLGRFELDDIAMNEVRRRGGRKDARVRVKSFKGFKLGLVVRAALLNRFYSLHFPRYDDSKNIKRWWKDYYRLTLSAQRRGTYRAG
jgi:hypothetical protein